MQRRELVVGFFLVPRERGFRGDKAHKYFAQWFPNRTPIYVLIDALRAFGHENGSMAEIEEGNAERLEALVSGLASKKRDVTIALTSPAVVALKKLDSGACSCGAPTGICALPLSFVRSVNDLR